MTGVAGPALVRRATTTGTLLAVALLAACAEEYPQSTIAPKTDFGDVTQTLYVAVFWWTMLILAVVWSVLAYVLVRYRERPGAPRPKPVHGHMGLEIAWTIAPALIVVAIVIPTIQGVFQTQRPPPEGAMIVEVTGQRYWWSFHYPELDVTTANELHLPVGRPVSLRLASGDIIHSFWVPQLGGKRDVNPVVRVPEGESRKYNWLHFTVREPGVFMGQCAEFCGDSHALMGIRVIAESESDFQAWVQRLETPSVTAVPLEAQPPEAEPAAAEAEGELQAASDPAAVDPAVAQGREIFHRSTCIACHTIQGTNAMGILGPSLSLLGERATIGAGYLENNRENLIRWIRSPQSFKPGAPMPGSTEEGGGMPPTNLSDEEIQAVAAYLASLR
jgi:cytochrome c oxidase subunit 2